tara:strand:+ start:931 stop:1230 length:300 start_codon:yes stop_codon:yes gene_type:complete
MALCQINPISMDRFTWISRENTLVTEISDLGPNAFSQIWDDACDVGLAIRSPKTGTVVVFSCVEDIRHPTTLDFFGWLLRPIPGSPLRVRDLKVKIYND